MSERSLGRTLYVLADRSLSRGCRLAQVLEQACNATRSDVNSYGPKQVAAWIAAKLVSAKYDASEIQQARGVNLVCTIRPSILFPCYRHLRS